MSSCLSRPQSRSPARSARRPIHWRSSSPLRAAALRIEWRPAINLDDATAQAELGHLDDIAGLLEDLRLPALTPGMNFHQEFTRLDHDDVEIVRPLAVPAELQVNLLACVRG